jgi:hypothetical protein
MRRSFRYDIAAATAALCPASFGTFLGLFFAYFSAHPAKPNAALGFVHALNNHGSYVYLSDAESTGFALLRNVFMIGLFGMFRILPKDPALAPPGTARWLTHFYVSKTDLANPTPRLKAILLSSTVFYLAVIYLAGPSIVRFVVSRGIVLQP